MNTIHKIALGLLLILVSISIVACSNTYLGRYIRWNFPDVYDLTKFPFVHIKRGGEVRHFVESIQPMLADMNVKHENVTVQFN
jgi:hypothetical protein